MAENNKRQKKEKPPADFSAAFPSFLIGIAAVIATPFVIRAYHEPILTASMILTATAMFTFSEIFFRHIQLKTFELDLSALSNDLAVMSILFVKYASMSFVAVIAERIYLGDILIK